MRLDKFLKVSRLIKRRSVAKEVTDKGRVQINGRIAKASTTVKPGDELFIQFGQKQVTVRVDELKETTKKDESGNMFTVIREELLPREEEVWTSD